MSSPCCRAIVKRTGKPCSRRVKYNTWFCGLHMNTIIRPPDYRPSCPICLCPVPEYMATKTSCNHVFHNDCLDQWIKYDKHTCPMCRKNIYQETKKANVNRWEQTMPQFQRELAVISS